MIIRLADNIAEGIDLITPVEKNSVKTGTLIKRDKAIKKNETEVKKSMGL